ncbi:MAG: hypothetical protein D6681_22030 [Calditrichaeota bacterium]|nr:MAG: hypothetical protein D6681_22030 [Calditrichota bacterium]
MKRKINLLILLLAVWSCSNPGGSDKIPEDTTVSTPSLIPLAAGNTWTYTEEYISPDTNYVTEYTVRVTGTEQIGDEVWWKLETWRGDSVITRTRYLIAQNDSIYELQYNWQTPVKSLQYFIPVDSVQRFNSLLGGDVGIAKTASILDTTIITPQGNFSECYMFEYSTPDWTTREILSPKVGIIVNWFIHHPSLGGIEYERIARIKSYVIK